MLRQNMKASSQEKANCVPPSRLTPKLTPKPMTATRPPATMRMAGTERHLDKSSGGSLAEFLGALILLFQIPAFTLRHIVDRREVTQLQCAQVSNDRPTIFRRHIRPVGAHRVSTIRNHVKNFAIGVFHNLRV